LVGGSLSGGRIYGSGVIRQVLAEQKRREARDLVESEIALTHEEAIEMAKLICAKGVDAAVVKVALPDWRAKTADFLDVALGPAYRAAFKGSAVEDDPLESLEAEARFLSDLSLKLTVASIRVDEDALAHAIKTRRESESANFFAYKDSPARDVMAAGSLPHRIDDLHRDGIDLLAELSVPVKPEKRHGGWRISGEDPPSEWWDKADGFDQRVRDLFIAEYPALLSDYANGANAHLRKRREKVAAEREPDPNASGLSDAEKMHSLANYWRSGPAQKLEASLQGLAVARHRVAS